MGTGKRDTLAFGHATRERRQRFRAILLEQDGVDPNEVIFSPAAAKARGLASTVTFLRGNLAPHGAILKSAALDPSLLAADGVYRKEGPARVFTRETEAIAAIKKGWIAAGDILVLAGCGPLGGAGLSLQPLQAMRPAVSPGKRQRLDRP